MRSPTLTELPPPPPGRTGWPWTEESQQLAEMMPAGHPWPRISIVTPSYNQGQFIEETIRSVLLQGYPNLEYIIMDGGSTDESVEIIRKYETWLTYWVSRPDKGQTDAINQGFACASGEILAWLNSDDTYLPAVLQEAVNALDDHPETAMVYGKSKGTDPVGRQLQVIGWPFDWEAMLTTLNTVPQPSAFIRQQYAAQAGPLNLDYYYVMDWDYWLRLGLLGDIRFVDALWSTHKIYPAAKTGRWPVAIFVELMKVFKTFHERQDLPGSIARLKRRSFMWINITCANGYYAEGNLNRARYHTWRALQADWRALLLPEWRERFIRVILGPTRIDVIKKILRGRFAGTS